MTQSSCNWVHTIQYWLKIFLYLSFDIFPHKRRNMISIYNNWLSKWDIFWENSKFSLVFVFLQRIHTYIQQLMTTAIQWCLMLISITERSITALLILSTWTLLFRHGLYLNVHLNLGELSCEGAIFQGWFDAL